MENVNALKQERAGKLTEMRTLIDAAEQRGATVAEDQQSIERIEAEIRGLDERIGNGERLQRLESGIREDADRDAEERGQRLQGGDVVDPGAQAEYREAFVAYLRGDAGADEMRTLRNGYVADEVRDQVKGTAAKGGYVAPDEFSRTLIERVEELSEVRQFFTNVLRTKNGNKIDMTAEDARGAAAWIAEGGAFTANDEEFKPLDIEAHKAGRLVKASFELVEDSMFDLPSYLARKGGESIAILEDAAITLGNGTNKPTGYMVDAANGVTGALLGADTSAATSAYEELMDLLYSVRPAYRRRGIWMVADLAVRELRKLKDGNGRPIWQDSVRDGEATTMLGKPVMVDVNMADPAASAKPIAFGDPSAYLIREVEGVNVLTLRERYAADEGKVGFLMWRRMDGKLLDTDAIKTLTLDAAYT